MGKILSIEIDNCNIKLLEGSKSGTTLTIHNSVFLESELGCIDDGVIKDMELVAEAIANALTENNIKTKNAIFMINTNSIITRIIELPLLNKSSETMSMIHNELEQIISADLNQYKIVYKLIEIISYDDGKQGKYIVYGLPASIFNQYIELAEALKLNMISLDLAFNSLDRIADARLSIDKKPYDKAETSAFIDFSYNTISFSVLSDGKNEFSRMISNGMKDIVRNYATVYNLSNKEALAEIHKLSLVKSYDDPSDIAKLSIIEDVINGWVDELNRYLRYYNSNNKEKQILNIYIYGTYADIEGIEEYLSSRFNMKVEMVKELSTLAVKHSKANENFNVRTYFNTLLAMYGTRKDINFLTDSKKKHSVRFNIGIVLLASSFIVVLTLVFYLYGYIAKQNTLENELTYMTKFIESEDNIRLNEEVEEFKNKVTLLEKYKGEVDKVKVSIKNEDAVNSRIFEEIAKALPENSRVNSMSIDKASMQMQCSSESESEPAQFENNLKQIEFVDYVYIPAVTESAKDNGTIYSYSVVCEIKDVIIDEAE